MSKSIQFSIIKEAINNGDYDNARGMLSHVVKTLTKPYEYQLADTLKNKIESGNIPNSNESLELELSNRTTKKHLLMPHLEGDRHAELGLRTQGVVKKDKTNLPLVSVITVVFNRVETIRQCIESVLNQTYENIEYIIIDGGSTDGALEILHEYNDVVDYVLSESDLGIYNAMNKGLSLASGTYISMLNADDYYFPRAIELSIFNIIENQVDLSYAGLHYASADGVVIIADEGRDWNDSMLIQGIPGGHETILAHRNCYEVVGGYDETYRIAADYKWVMAVYKHGFRAKRLDQIILAMRAGGASFHANKELEENFKLLRENFGELNDEELNDLYNLKFYKSWHGCSLSNFQLTSLYEKFNSSADILKRSLHLTILERKKELRGNIVPGKSKKINKLNICIALTYLTNVSGGAERIAIEAANELAKRGHKVTIVSCYGMWGEPYYRMHDDIEFIDLAIDPYKSFYFKYNNSFALNYNDISGRVYDGLDYTPNETDFNNWIESGHLWKIQIYKSFFDMNDFDFVLSHMPSTFPYVLLGLSGQSKAVHVAALHSTPKYKFYSNQYPAESNFDRYMRLFSLEKSNLISILFDEYIDQMPDNYKDRCFKLPNFINNSNHYDAKPRGKFILSVGRLVEEKDHVSLLRAFSLIRFDYPDWRLRIYGTGPLKEYLYNYSYGLGLNPDEIFMGSTKEIDEVYSGASIYVLPSKYEGFGLTVVEAMKHGLPVIAYDDCDGVRFLIKNEINGFLIPRSEDGDTLAEKLKFLIGDESARIRVGSAGKLVSSQYTVEKHVDALLSNVLPHINSNDSVFLGSDLPVTPLIVSTYLEGGAGNAALRLHQGLIELGVESKTLSFSDGDYEHNFQIRLNDQEQSIYDRSKKLYDESNRHEGSTIFSPSYPGLNFSQLDFCKNFNIVNLHWVQHLISPESIYYLNNLGLPIVWTLHDMNPFTGGCHYTHGCERYKSNCSNCPQLINDYDDFPSKIINIKQLLWDKRVVVVTPSKWLANCARESVVFRDAEIVVIPNSVDTNIFHPTDKLLARSKFSLPVGKKILLFSCQTHEEKRKGFAELVKVISFLPGDKDDYHILGFGNSTREIEKLGISHTFLGHINDPSILALGYCAADVTILPSLEDNLPNIILESVSCGTPVVAFDAGGVGDAVINGLTGYLVPLYDCKLMAHMIKKCSEENFTNKCREYALKHFRLEVQANRYSMLFQRLLSNKTHRSIAPPISQIYEEHSNPIKELIS